MLALPLPIGLAYAFLQ